MVYFARVPLRGLIPTVLVRLATEDGEEVFRARWKASALELQRLISFKLRRGRPLWFEDESGHNLCFRPEGVRAAMVRPALRRLKCTSVPPSSRCCSKASCRPSTSAASSPVPCVTSAPTPSTSSSSSSSGCLPAVAHRNRATSMAGPGSTRRTLPARRNLAEGLREVPTGHFAEAEAVGRIRAALPVLVARAGCGSD